MPLDPDVDLGRIAAVTPGMVGADLANLCNEAALLAARREHAKVKHEDFTDALEKIILGAPRKLLMCEDDRRRTAYHEAGHAIVGMFTAGADPVRKVSIIPRGRALGVTFSSPDSDRISYDKQALEAKIDVALGGRVAEEVVFDTITTGAESDIEQVTGIARAMVGRWGMSPEIGFVAVVPQDGGNPFMASETSDELKFEVDRAVKSLVDTAHERVTAPAARAARASWTRWPTPCSTARRSTRTRPTRPPGWACLLPPRRRAARWTRRWRARRSRAGAPPDAQARS